MGSFKSLVQHTVGSLSDDTFKMQPRSFLQIEKGVCTQIVKFAKHYLRLSLNLGRSEVIYLRVCLLVNICEPLSLHGGAGVEKASHYCIVSSHSGKCSCAC